VLDVIADSPLQKFGTSRARIDNLKKFDHILQNTKELTEQTELDRSSELSRIIESFFKKLKVKDIIVTMGGKGAIAFRFNNGAIEPMIVESEELMENIDPCGCGDMFYSAYSSSIMAGFDTETSIKIANSSARVVARKLFGTGQATPEEIADEYRVLYPKG
jgi:sugar/nucleoside kinase (ribokinase family)